MKKKMTMKIQISNYENDEKKMTMKIQIQKTNQKKKKMSQMILHLLKLKIFQNK